MTRARYTPTRIALMLVLTAVYIAAGKLGLSLASVNASASAVWPPTGLAIAYLLLFGLDFFPAVTLGAFVVNLTTSGEPLSSAGIAAGNTLEAVVAATLVTRWAAGPQAFERPTNVLRFALLAAVVAPAVSATIGVSTLALAGLASWSDFGPIWLTWWLGDASGALVVTPVVVLWIRASRDPVMARTGELLALGIATAGTAYLIFGSATTPIIVRYPFLTFPAMIWAAFRFGSRVAATVVFATGVIAIWGTLNGVGPYTLESENASLIALQAFMAVAAMTTLTLAAAVSERERTEARLLAIEHESRRVAEEAARLREEFLSVATHELRTPLTALSGYAQLASRAVATDRREQVGPAIEAIQRQASRLGELVTRLLDASRTHAGRLDLHLRPTDLSELTAQTVDAMQTADNDTHRWDVRIDEAIQAEADPLRWEQVVANLLDNALKYSPNGRTVSVRLRRDGGGPITLEVSDDGIGIPPERLEHVFDRFYRAHDDQGMGGLGLGLYITREIVMRHGGHVAVRSTEHRGTTFTVTLPPRSAHGTVAHARESSPEPPPTDKRGCVLVVDDDRDVRELVTTVLSDVGLDVSTAENGEDALVVAARWHPDVILLDKLMPVMDGAAFVQAYRETTHEPAPIIAFCAARDAESWSREIGAVAHVKKPFVVEELEAAVLSRVSRSPSAGV